MAIESVSDFIESFDFIEIHKIFFDNSYYQILFPFLLIYAVLTAVLPYIRIFRNKTTGEPLKPIIILISLIISLFGVTFETSAGYTVGDFMVMLFPNISALTMGILMLLFVGSMLNKNFFKDLFAKDASAYMYFAVGAIGLGAVIFYLGIVMGLWDYNYLDPQAYWNVVLAIGFLIMGVVFLIIGFYGVGMIFLLVVGAFIYNYGEGNILEQFIDPVIFVIFLVIIMLSWLGTNSENKYKMMTDMRIRARNLRDNYPEEGEKGRIGDIVDVTQKRSLKKWKEKYGDEKWDENL